MTHPFDAVTLAELRTRESAKWRHYGPDVLPAWVAEMDYPLAEPIADVLRAAIARNDLGYATPTGLGEIYAAWAEKTYGEALAPRDVFLVPDVVTGLAELIRVGTAPGDAVVIDPPVYPPFASTVRGLGRALVEVPLRIDESGRAALDLAGLARAYAAGAKMHILCSPQNPTGIVHPRADLEALAALADAHGVLVLADEIHAPLTLAGATHVPFLTVSAAARRNGLGLVSASKSWNLAGLKAALVTVADARPRALLSRLPAELPYHAGHLGVLAAKAAFTSGDPWRRSVHAILERNRALLLELLGAALPEVQCRPPEASYLSWLDCRGLGLGRDPARVFLERGKVALSPGPTFGVGGEGFARLNLATTRTLLEEAVRRMAHAVAEERAVGGPGARPG